MKLSTCRNLKREVQSNAYRLAEDAVNAREYRLRKAGGRRKQMIQTREAAPVAAVGIAPGKDGDYKLAVRLFRGMDGCKDDLLKGLDLFKDMQSTVDDQVKE